MIWFVLVLTVYRVLDRLGERGSLGFLRRLRLGRLRGRCLGGLACSLVRTVAALRGLTFGGHRGISFFAVGSLSGKQAQRIRWLAPRPARERRPAAHGPGPAATIQGRPPR